MGGKIPFAPGTICLAYSGGGYLDRSEERSRCSSNLGRARTFARRSVSGEVSGNEASEHLVAFELRDGLTTSLHERRYLLGATLRASADDPTLCQHTEDAAGMPRIGADTRTLRLRRIASSFTAFRPETAASIAFCYRVIVASSSSRYRCREVVDAIVRPALSAWISPRYSAVTITGMP